ncbi:MAG: VWA domain-containing protein [Bacteroidales bacterium]|nr:VWA domain-containing protein [Bacteroidales bacterium]HPI86576.1 VWA domain-containing protein [Bacteroidales bacterium]
MEFANPGFLYLLLLVPMLIAWYIFRHGRSIPTLQVSDTAVFENNRRSFRHYLYHLLFVLRMVAVALLIIAFARPQSTTKRQNVSIEGIDIVLGLDISGSMLAQDLKPDRLEAAKKVSLDFFQGRPNDRIGLVVFAGEAFTQCPLTTDHVIIEDMLDDIESGIIQDGTAIGDGLATAINRLKESQAVSKVIILLTDGQNNAGSIAPLSAAEIAKIYGIRIYTIGVGTIGFAPYPVQTPFGVQYQNMEVKIDEDLLQKVANMTDGKYFRATDNTKLREVYQEIDQLEKSKIDVTEFRKKHEEYLILAVWALILLALESLMRFTLFRSLP